MVNKKKSKLERIDTDFAEMLRSSMAVRAGKGLARNTRDEMSLREATFLARTTPSFPTLLSELQTLPKRRKKQ